ncbi:MAG: class IV adenylate cyclase [Planctomycetales bacterium]|nr:class IV adenylate cyclase [Planctomycetales bacterium]
MPLEIEQKFRVENLEAVRGALAGIGAQPLGVQSQSDQYFAHPGRDFRQTGEALRIRSTDKAACITYKGPKLDQVVKTRPEIELPLGESGAEFAELLAKLGFKPVAVVQKQRERFAVTSGKYPLEVALDSVDWVGQFVEIEAIAQEPSVNLAKAEVVKLAKKLGLTNLEPRSYLRMLLESKDS